jgi:hypothetical protein
MEAKYGAALSAVWIDVDNCTEGQRELFRGFGLKGTPSVVITKPDGSVYDTIVGGGSANEARLRRDLIKIVGR